MKRIVPLLFLTMIFLFQVHANERQDSIPHNQNIKSIEDLILNQELDSALILIGESKKILSGNYVDLLERIALTNNVTNREYYTFTLRVSSRPNLAYRTLSDFINSTVKEPPITKSIDIDYVYIKWLQVSKLRDYATIEEANVVHETLEKYISNFDSDQPDSKRARILSNTHNIVLFVIQKKIKEGKELSLSNLEKARQLNDPTLQIVSLYHLSDFLIEEKKLQEYIDVSEESLALEDQLPEKSPYYVGTVIHLVNAYIFAGGYDNQVKELLDELYSNPKTQIQSYSLFAQYLTTIKPNSLTETEIFKLLGVGTILEFCSKIKILTEDVLNSNDMYHVLNQSVIALENRGYYREANEYMRKCLRLREKVYSEELSSSLANFQTKQAIKEKEKKIAHAEEKSKLYSIIAVLFICLFLIAIYFLYKNNKQRNLLNTKNEFIKRSLDEKEELLQKNQLLFKEMHHRVKNNFQIISSLLELQSSGTENKTALKLAAEVKTRINVMALIHQKLYKNDDLVIEIDDYISKLIHSISDLYNKNVQPIVTMNIPKYEFDIDTAIPLGLIINEIITNSFKYGFDKIDPRLDVSLSKTKDNFYKLSITDNGEGLPTDFDFDTINSLGLRLIRRLSKQLHGNSFYSQTKGCNFSVIFLDTSMRLETA